MEPSPSQTVLLLGATGRTGRRTLAQLLDRGLRVRAIVRSAGKLPPELAGHPNLTVIEAGLPSLPDAELRRHLAGCDAVVSCLGHVLSLAGVFGPPRDLVARATARVCRALRALAPPAPVKLVVMTSVSVNGPGRRDGRRSGFERAFLGLLRGVLPPARDNQRAADFLVREIGPRDPSVEWTVLRPDTLGEGERAPYAVHEGIVDGLFRPGATRMESLAHLICELVTDPATWGAWRSRLPVVVDAVAASAGSAPAPRAHPPGA